MEVSRSLPQKIARRFCEDPWRLAPPSVTGRGFFPAFLICAAMPPVLHVGSAPLRPHSFNHSRMIATVSLGLLSASSPTCLIASACTFPLNLAISSNRPAPPSPRLPSRAISARRAPAVPARRGDPVRLDDAAHQRPHDDQYHHDREQPHHQKFDAAHDVVFGELEDGEKAAGFAHGKRRRFGEARVDDLYLVAAALVEADRRTDQCGNAVEV